MSKHSWLVVSIVASVIVGSALVACGTEMSEAPDTEAESATSHQAAQVSATAAIVNGNCAKLSEVGMEFAENAIFKVAGGWTTSNTAGNGVSSWSATSLNGCNTYNPPSSPYKNNVTCYYRTQTYGSWEGPTLRASKTYPTQYDCTCNDSTGAYTCIRQ